MSDIERSRLRSLVRPVRAAFITTGLDEVRMHGSYQTGELRSPDSTPECPCSGPVRSSSLTFALATLAPHEITLELDSAVLAEALGFPVDDLSPDLPDASAPVHLRRRGVETKLVVGTPEPDPDPVLLRTLADAHRWATALRDGTPISQVAHEADHHDAFIRTRGSLAFLSPKIQLAIRGGTIPPEFTLRRMLQRPVPLDWQEQERLYGICSREPTERPTRFPAFPAPPAKFPAIPCATVQGNLLQATDTNQEIRTKITQSKKISLQIPCTQGISGQNRTRRCAPQ